MSPCKVAASLSVLFASHALRYANVPAKVMLPKNSDWNFPIPVQPIKQCQNRTIFVMTGLPRSGVNSMLTIADIWMHLLGPDYAGYHHANEADPKYFEGLIEEGLRLVLQADTPTEWLTNIADVMLTSHRNPLDILTSAKLVSGMGAWTDCEKLMLHQKLVYMSAEKCCGGIEYDMAMDTLLKEPATVVRNIGLALGICESELTEGIVNYVNEIYHADIPVQEGFETWHTDDQKTDIRTWAQGEVERTPACRLWNNVAGRFSDEVVAAAAATPASTGDEAANTAPLPPVAPLGDNAAIPAAPTSEDVTIPPASFPPATRTGEDADTSPEPFSAPKQTGEEAPVFSSSVPPRGEEAEVTSPAPEAVTQPQDGEAWPLDRRGGAVVVKQLS